MTHFLARLVDRARGKAPRVKPVIASPLVPLRTTEVESGDELSESQERQTAAKPALATATEFRLEDELREAQDPEDLAKSKSGSARGPMKTIESKQTAPSAKRRETRAAEIVHEPLLVPHVQREMQDTLVTHSPLEPEANAQHARITPIDKTSTRERQAVWTTRRFLQVQRPRRPSDEAENRRAPDGAREQAPIVRVTIGRIEVRAVQQPAPAPKPAKPAPPKLSLDEYLRGRKR